MTLTIILQTKFCTTKKASGSDLLSHTVTGAVPSALEGLTAVFGMGTGVTPPPLPPESLYELLHLESCIVLGISRFLRIGQALDLLVPAS